MEEHVIVVKEQEGKSGHVHSVLLVGWVVNVQMGHIIIPLFPSCSFTTITCSSTTRTLPSSPKPSSDTHSCTLRSSMQNTESKC
jgi:hypothetical protein